MLLPTVSENDSANVGGDRHFGVKDRGHSPNRQMIPANSVTVYRARRVAARTPLLLRVWGSPLRGLLPSGSRPLNGGQNRTKVLLKRSGTARQR